MLKKPLPCKDWLKFGCPNEKLFLHPDVTRREIYALAATVCCMLRRRKEQRIAIAFNQPSTFVAALLGTLAAKKSPVLFAYSRGFLNHHEGYYDLLLTKPGMKTVVPTLIWDGEIGQESMTLEISDDVGIVLYTSGSSGVPKEVLKPLRIMDVEAKITARLFANKIKGSVLATTVDLAHLYGLTFSVWMPLSQGIPILNRVIRFPEEISTQDGRVSLISSPTFIRNLDTDLPHPKFSFVLSAGAPLKTSDKKKAFEWFGVSIDEVYGSTETGVIAIRSHAVEHSNLLWHLIPGAQISVTDGKSMLKSPLLIEKTEQLDDKIQLFSEMEFSLQGRVDRIVKIGERRFNLGHVEKHVSNVVGVPVFVTGLDRGNRIAVGVVLNTDKPLSVKIIKTWQEELRKVLDPLVIPRFWRVKKVFPHDAQGKLDTKKLLETFDG